MKKLVLSIGLGSYLVFGAAAGALAANRADETAGAVAIREGDNASAASRWLLFVDEPRAPETSIDQSAATNLLAAIRRLRFIDASLYSETSAVESAVVASPGAHGEQERADMAQPYTADQSAVTNLLAAIRRLRFIDASLYSETSAVESAVVASPGAHGEQERADMAQPYTAETDTERLLCDGDICLVP